MRSQLRRLLIAVSLIAGLVVANQLPVSAAATDCLSYGYACTPGYTGANTAGTWAWSHYGGSYATTPNGYHNCTLYAAWRLQQSGMTQDPGNWGNAVDWASHIGGGNHTPAAGSIAWYGATPSSPYGHVAYVEQVSGANVYIRADNYSTMQGYTDAGWVASSSVGLFLHPHDLAGDSGKSSSAALTGHWNRWNNGDHSALTGTAPVGATFEGTFGDLLSVQVAGTAPLYSCNAGGDEFTSQLSNCEGQKINGLLGYIYTSPPAGVVTHGIWRCTAGDHFDSVTSNCEGQHVESLLGYTIAQD